jgi:hypothetical protein
MKTTPEPEISDDIQEMEFDKISHFVGSKKTNMGSLRPWIMAAGELLPGLQGVVMLQRSDDSMKKSGI